MPQEEPYFYTCPSICSLVIASFTGIVLICCISCLRPSCPNNISLIQIGGILLSCYLIFKILKSLKSFVDFVHKKFEVEELKRYKTFALIGFGGITLCTIIPRVCVYFIGPNIPVFCYCIILPIFVIISLNYIFIMEKEDYWKLVISNNAKFVRIILITNFISLIVTVRILVFFYTDEQEKELIGACLIGFALLCVPSSVEFGIILNGGFRLSDNKQSYYLETVKVQNDEDEASSSSRIECEICMRQYNKSSRIPRLLKECGHTICEDCAHNLLTLKYRHVIFCPFCQRPTLVNGRANLLPKNYIALEMIHG